MPLDGLGCLFLPPSDAPSPSAAGLRASFSHRFPAPFTGEEGRGRTLLATKLGQQCCPIGNMANSGRQHKSETRRAIDKVGLRVSRPIFPRRPPVKWTTAAALAQWAVRPALVQFGLMPTKAKPKGCRAPAPNVTTPGSRSRALRLRTARGGLEHKFFAGGNRFRRLSCLWDGCGDVGRRRA